MNRFVVLALAGFVAYASAMPFDVLAPHDPCHTCDFIVGRAEHHFRKNETQAQLKAKLDRECAQLTHYQGQEAAKHCQTIIDGNIAKIYNDIEAGKHPHQVCVDIGECQPAPTHADDFADVKAPHDPCHTCDFIVGRAEHHFRKNETQAQLKAKLDRECAQLTNFQGQEAAKHCQTIVDGNIAKIYNDIEAGKHPHQVCVDIGECQPPPTHANEFAEFDDSRRPRDPCHICDFVMRRAEHHIHNAHINTTNGVLRELEHDCIALAHNEGDQASVQCLSVVQHNINKIFTDIMAHKTPKQVCQDLGECPTAAPATVPPSAASH